MLPFCWAYKSSRRRIRLKSHRFRKYRTQGMGAGESRSLWPCFRLLALRISAPDLQRGRVVWSVRFRGRYRPSRFSGRYRIADACHDRMGLSVARLAQGGPFTGRSGRSSKLDRPKHTRLCHRLPEPAFWGLAFLRVQSGRYMDQLRCCLSAGPTNHPAEESG